MDEQEMRDRINPMHRDMLRSMLKLNELPEGLLVQYFAVKKLLDKISAPMSACDLLRIAMDCGFNLDTMRFDGLGIPAKPIEEAAVEAAKEPEKAENVLEADEAIARDKAAAKHIREDAVAAVEEATEPEANAEFSVNGETGESPDKIDEDNVADPELASDEPETEDKIEPLSAGTGVSVFHEGEIVAGIVNGSKEDDDKGLIYSIETEAGDIIEVEEKNVEVN